MNRRREAYNATRATQRLALDELPQREAVVLPWYSLAGDGLGCRCTWCRHERTWNRKPHVRTVNRERARRQARRAKAQQQQ